MVIVVTAVGVRKVVEKWLCENMTCELVVSRNARHECCVEVIYERKPFGFAYSSTLCRG